jgi:hypothetical protein
MPIDPFYNAKTEFDKCMDDLNEALYVLVYTRLALDLKLDLTKHLFPILFPPFNPLKTIRKYL